ncbi:MAG: hypothetical protein CM1200mP7_3010 [Chloroflexota bacterium]|nr:MAG: hypothetical protein CM1200mP7_3010 [Chloroflexota bacterium]
MDFNYNSDTKNWDFETDDIKCSFPKPDGEKNGLKSLIHKSTGFDLYIVSIIGL